MPIVVSIDGEIVPPEYATISVFDRGLLYGDGCFEVLRTWQGRPVALRAHLERLIDAARFLQLRIPALDWFTAQVGAALAFAGKGEHRIRIMVTRGPGALGARFSELGTGPCIVIVEPLGEQPTEVSLAVVDWPVPRRPVPSHKTLSYLDHVLAREYARARGADEAIRLDHRGFVAEGGTCNVFAVIRGAVVTPPADRGVLPGIVRGRVLAVAERAGLVATVRDLGLTELHGAEEWFVTSSLRGVVPATRLDGFKRAVGRTTMQLAALYQRTASTE